MSKAKWIMKQYWRVGTIRAISGVAMGMLVLGRYYYGFIPPLAELGFIGALLLGSILFIVFLGFGYIYDARLKLWNEKIQIENEKSPYTYIPYIRYYYFEYPFFFAILQTLKRISIKLNIDGTQINELIDYLSDYYSRKAESRSDLFDADAKAEAFREIYPFIENAESPDDKWSIGHRAKKNSLLNIWRWNWVQNFTGLPQDVMVLAALLGAVIYSEFLVDNTLPSEYLQLSVTFLALPLFVLLLFVGWYYDRRLKLWTPDQIVKVERNPYSYVPDPKLLTYGTPFYNGILNFYIRLFSRLGLDKSDLVKLATYLYDYSELSAAHDEDMAKARQLRKEFGPIFSEVE